MLQIDLDEQQTKRLQEVANRLNVSVSDLAKAAVNDLISKSDTEFEQAANRILQKNADLYNRLV